MKITAVLIPETIEPSLRFWTEKVGFEKITEVPEGGSLAFAILQKDGAELMLQTRASAKADVPEMGEIADGQSIRLFMEVPDFNDLLRRIAGTEVVMPERTTFYGMREIIVREPGGYAVCFASPVTKS